MNQEKKVRIQESLESITRKYWFFFLILVLQGVPPYAAKGYDPAQTGAVVAAVLRNALVYSWESWYPVFKIIPLLLFAGLITRGKKTGRIFSMYAGITYVIFAFFQSIAFTEQFGWGVVTVNLVMFLLVAFFWFWEAAAGKNDFSPPKRRSFLHYWAILPALLAFWMPVNPITAAPEFNPLYFLTSGAGLAFCMMTPVYLAVLFFYYPRVNIPVLRVTTLVGVIIGLYNAVVNFYILPGVLWWNGILHLPLLVISLAGLVLSFQKVKESALGEPPVRGRVAT